MFISADEVARQEVRIVNVFFQELSLLSDHDPLHLQ